MEIKERNLTEYFYDAAINQICDDYRKHGYQVRKNVFLGRFYADILAQKGEENLVIEVKLRNNTLSSGQKENIEQLASYVKSLGNYKLLVAIAAPPREKKLVIAELEDLLTGYFSNNPPDEIEKLPGHSSFDSVSDIVIDEISVENGDIHVKGSGVMTASLQYGHDDKEEGNILHDSFAFDFSVLLEYENKKLHLKRIEELSIDTSDYSD
ncbi:MAG: hypothetical protein LBQ54_06435 [Planctomycetaceae bacterium]|jgi:Holliday junction resolvase|nr:hypothetical protein [Planctomycetaceae bacterium]